MKVKHVLSTCHLRGRGFANRLRLFAIGKRVIRSALAEDRTTFGRHDGAELWLMRDGWSMSACTTHKGGLEGLSPKILADTRARARDGG